MEQVENVRLTEEKLNRLWSVINAFTAEPVSFEELTTKHGHDIALALFLDKYRSEKGSWESAETAIKYRHCPTCAHTIDCRQNNKLYKSRIAGFLLEKIGPLVFDTICENLSPEFVCALFLAIKKRNNSRYEETTALLRENSLNWFT